MPNAPVKWTFGQLDAVLADIHKIADSKRTAFQSRLKNFHRLKFPHGFQSSKGKTATYSVGDIFMMALAVEMTQLGLSPERVVRVLVSNWFPVTMAARMAADALVSDPYGFDLEGAFPEKKDPLSMFLFFDPSALQGLSTDAAGDDAMWDEASSSFFYGGQGVIREQFVDWTLNSGRLSLLNITAMLDRLAYTTAAYTAVADPDLQLLLSWRRDFFAEVADWAEHYGDRLFGEGADAAAQKEFLESYLEYGSPGPAAEGAATVIRNMMNETGLPEDVCRQVATEYWERKGINVSPEA